MNKPYANRVDRMTDFLKQLFVYKININTMYLRCIQGLMTCFSILELTSEKLNKILGKEGSIREVFISYYSGVLKRVKKYPALLRYIDQWILENPEINNVFYDWLEEHYGHRDKEIFVDAVLHKMFN
jgi:hypothetical protein